LLSFLFFSLRFYSFIISSLTTIFSSSSSNLSLPPPSLNIVSLSDFLVWERSIAHEENKIRAAILIPITIEILLFLFTNMKSHKKVEEEKINVILEKVIEVCIHTLWSFCYGILLK
jgi:hypothetical protein